MRKKVLVIVMAVLAVIIGCKCLYEYKTNYTFRYRDFLEEITDVENKEAITNIRMITVASKTTTNIYVTVDEEKITRKQAIQMMKDSVNIYEEKVYDLQQTLIFNPGWANLYIKVIDVDSGELQYSCHAERVVNSDHVNEKTTVYWVFTISDKNGTESAGDHWFLKEIIW